MQMTLQFLLTMLRKQKNYSKCYITMKNLSGLKINRAKSEGLWLGANKNNNQKPLGLKWKTSIKLLGIHISYDKDYMQKQNFYSKIPKIQNILNRWKQRNLTIYGRILLIKSFVLSNILHVTSVLVPDDDFVKSIDRIMFEFLWGGKQHKVKKHVIIQDYGRGGCNMVSIQDKIHTQYINWVRKYFDINDYMWKTTMEGIINQLNVQIFLKSNFTIPKKISTFYQNVLETWKEMKSNKSENKLDILNQYIWYNSNVDIPINRNHYRTYMENGITQIKDIVNTNGTFLTFDNIQRIYKVQKTSYLFYQTIVNCIPKTWKNILRTNVCEEQNSMNDIPISINGVEYNIHHITAKQIYAEMVIAKYDISKAQSTYTEVYETVDEDWSKHYKHHVRLNIPPKVKENQYKIIQNYIATNKLLYKMNLISSPRCNFCNLYTQDTAHMFYSCLIIKGFWLEMNAWLSTEFGLQIDLNEKHMLLGDFQLSGTLNRIILFAKYYISKCKYSDVMPELEAFKAYIGKYL